jgi:hypothetical protein
VVTGGIRGNEPPAGVMTWDMRQGGMAADRGKLDGTGLSLGYAINESGDIAGVSIEFPTPSHRISHPVTTSPFGVWDLGQFQAVASSINERGDVLGWRTNGPDSSWYSWLYQPGVGMISDLRTVLETPDIVTRVSEALAINDHGQVIASITLSSGADPSRRSAILTLIAPPCGTADFNGDQDFGTDQDIEAFFACLAGVCCPNCYSGGADFNGDGDFGTDQDIEAFFRVLAGGNC